MSDLWQRSNGKTCKRGPAARVIGPADIQLETCVKGYHPCGASYGYKMYYLNVTAGPLRKWRSKNQSGSLLDRKHQCCI
jgi:5-deoxy-D-glucuronate isomerase